jgi:hypothetical protein
VSNDASISNFLYGYIIIIIIMLIHACFTFTGITNNGYIDQNTRSRGVRYNRV